MEEKELISEAMRVLGSRTSERKAAAARQNAEKARAVVTSEEHKAKLRAAQQARREREAAEKAERGLVETPAPKRPRGRPRKEVTNA